ncbi:MAG: formate dehydrogenase subunit gamma [Thiogranum sp.]
MNNNKPGRTRRPVALYSVLMALFSLMLALPMAPQAWAGGSEPAAKVVNPGTELWREVRQREAPRAGVTQVAGMDSGVLINIRGEQWRQFRMEQLIPAAGVLIGGVLGLIVFFHLLKRGVRLEHGRSGNYLLRFKEIDRILHWYVATVFIFLALTGLILLTGRVVLIPVFGHEVFSVIASASKEGHNLFGPLFLLGVIGLLIRFVSKNFPAKGDLRWLLKAGGFLGGKHPSAGFFNAGEKIWFWLVIFIGLTISATGLILEFPFFGQDRPMMELSLVLHGVGAVLLVAGLFGHIYVGTAGMEASLESMTSGYVDVNWARQHHDHWAEACEAEGAVIAGEDLAKKQRLRGTKNRVPDRPVTEEGR